MIRLRHRVLTSTVTLGVATALLVSGGRADAGTGDPETCNTGQLVGWESSQDAPKDLLIQGTCVIKRDSHYYANVHIWNGGKLIFDDDDSETHFWAANILVEKDGSLIAGSAAKPFGTFNQGRGKLTIHLYGPPQRAGSGKGVQCKTGATCGVPAAIWSSNVGSDGHPGDPEKARKISAFTGDVGDYRGPTDDYFYAYHKLRHDEGDDLGYFGYKVLGVSHGGTLQLYGKKGACTKDCTLPDNTGQSWVRLNETVKPGDPHLVVASPVDWKKNDQIVLTTTDYLPGHSELLTVKTDTNNGTTVEIDTAKTPIQYHHYGKRYPIPTEAVSKLGLSDFVKQGAETRAAVALLSRTIRIVSEGSTAKENFPDVDSSDCANPDPDINPKCYFGGHTVFRQGFTAVEIQGVEFFQMGQGGRIAHYPVHFHHARKTAGRAFVVDSSVWDSMTRWVVLHGTHDVTLARNVGYLSIGHGYYLEDGTEINNKLLANIGILARAAVKNVQNRRKVPGILAAPDLDAKLDTKAFPFKSDYDHPTVFWIMNTWNDFQYNFAAGAGACGACYWFVGGVNSTISRTVGGLGQRWDSYAGIQVDTNRAATTPLKSFIGNACTSAMTSIQTITITEPCLGIGPTAGDFPSLPHVPNPIAKKSDPPDLDYYPTVADGGRFPTQCGGPLANPDENCRNVVRCATGNIGKCEVFVIDRYTTSFNWGAFNFAAIWLRPQWYLVTDSVITDVQQAGLTMVTGGGYSSSDVVPGHWALVRKSVFIGHAQPEKNIGTTTKPIFMPDNFFAANGGPFNPHSTLRCAETGPDRNGEFSRPGNYCLTIDGGVSFPVSNYGMYQRLFSVYDGPAFQDSNAYLSIKRREMDDCLPFPAVVDVNTPDGRCDPDFAFKHRQSAWLAGPVTGLPRATKKVENQNVDFCFMPNAAIGWKQPNGFYYPPAFHSTNLYFGKDDVTGNGGVDVRHFVLSPIFKEGTFDIDSFRTGKSYCNWSSTVWNGFAGNDRQTVLNDNDGSLTGYSRSISVNIDDFFLAPVESIECRSASSARTSPYDYVTTVVYPRCVTTNPVTCAKPPNPKPPDGDGNPNTNFGDWNRACTDESCYGIPLFRQDLLPIGDTDPTDANKKIERSIRMMGQQTGQRSSLTVNHGTYYVDTTVSAAKQLECKTAPCVINLFKENETYYLFLIFAKETTAQTYRFYVGTDTAFDPSTIQLVQADIGPNPITFEKVGPAGAKWYKGTQAASKGVVEVTIKLTDLPDAATKFLNAKKAKCKPESFCVWNDAKGFCSESTFDTEKQKYVATDGNAICKWAGADPVDCPQGGCLGIAFTLPAGFKTAPAENPRPTPTCLESAVDGICTPFNVHLDTRTVSDTICPVASEILKEDFCTLRPDPDTCKQP